MATAVLSAQDCLGCSQFVQGGAKSGKVSAHFWSLEYNAPEKSNYVVPHGQVPHDYQPDVLRTSVNSEGRICMKSSNTVEGPNKGRSLVTILKRGRTRTAKDVKRISKGVNPLKNLRTLRSASDAVDDREGFHSEKWAGPVFVNSPSPSCLPLPKFSVKKSVEGMDQVDSSATRDLRQLLGLG